MREKLIMGNEDYAVVATNEYGETIYMDRLIMNADDDEEVIHLNGDPFDCRRENLMLVKIGYQIPN